MSSRSTSSATAVCRPDVCHDTCEQTIQRWASHRHQRTSKHAIISSSKLRITQHLPSSLDSVERIFTCGDLSCILDRIATGVQAVLVGMQFESELLILPTYLGRAGRARHPQHGVMIVCFFYSNAMSMSRHRSARESSCKTPSEPANARAHSSKRATNKEQ